MSELETPTIATEWLPADYQKTTAEKFGIQPDTVGRIARGTRKNPEVFDFLLDLAEQGKTKHLKQLKRAESLKTPIAE